MKELRRGKLPPQDYIDLHGLTSHAAHEILRDFILSSHRRGLRCVRVVHGKGISSGAKGPVLKAGVNAWLRHWDEVKAFCSAQDRDGGTGAVYVLLRKH